MEEQLAIVQLKQGDINGLDRLIDLYQVQAVRAAHFVTRDRALAEDVVQNAFLRLCDCIGTFDGRRPFKPWFFRLVVNDAIKAAQAQNRSRSFQTVADDAPASIEHIVAQAQLDPGQITEQHELCDRVREAINQLPPAQRAAIVCRYYLDMPAAEIASTIDRTPGTIKQLLHRAKKQLRILLGPLSSND